MWGGFYNCRQSLDETWKWCNGAYTQHGLGLVAQSLNRDHHRYPAVLQADHNCLQHSMDLKDHLEVGHFRPEMFGLLIYSFALVYVSVSVYLCVCVCVFVSGLLQLHKSSILAFCFDYSRMGVMITTYLIHLCTFIFIALISPFFSSFLLSIYSYFRILLLFFLPSFLISFAYTIFGNFNCTFIQMLKQLPYFLNSLLYSNLLPF